MGRARLLRLAGSLLLLASCGGPKGSTPTTPTAPVATVSVSLTNSTLAPGGTTTASATLRDASGGVLAGRAIAWTSSSTTTATVSNSGEILAVAPGTTTITATSEGKSGGATLTVTPPPVASVTVTLALNQLAPGGTTIATAELRDAGGAIVTGRQVIWSSSSTSVATVGASGNVLAVAPGTTTITATSEGRSGGATLTVTAPALCANPVNLAPGQALRLTTAVAACMQFPAAPNARYLVAYADSRLVAKAATGPEFPWPADFTVTLADLAQPGTGPGPAPATAASRPVPLPMPAAIPPECPLANLFAAFCRATPYVMDEVFTHYPLASSRPSGPAKVVAIRGNLVLAVFQADAGLVSPNGVANATLALDRMVARVVPLYRTIWDLAAPSRTTDESGQLLIVVEQPSGGLAGGATWYPDAAAGHGRWGQVFVAPSLLDSPVAGILGLLAHEVLHTYQYRWRFEHAGPWRTVLGTGWAVEGGGSLALVEMMREHEGIAFLANSTNPNVSYGLIADLTLGYHSAASFLRDLVQRLVTEGGLTFDVALREVLVGALEGWYGISDDEGRLTGPGLVSRMRSRLGASWDPVNALLEWTMSQAADDLTANTRYQNLSERQPTPSTTSNPIRPDAVVQAGGTGSRTRTAGNTGVIELRLPAGGAFAATARVSGVRTSAVEWLVLRIQ